MTTRNARLTSLLWICLSLCSIAGSLDVHDSENSNMLVGESAENLRLESYAGLGGNRFYAEEIWQGEPGEERTSGGVSAKCQKLLDVFTNTTTLFLKCVMDNARPLHYCENCVGEFSSVNNAYNEIADVKDDEENGTTCQDELLRADNVQVILLVYDFVQNVWDKSTCHNCYYSVKVNGTTVYHATKETRTMLKKIQDTQECFHDFQPELHINNMSVCSACNGFYSKANTYYNNLDDRGKLCSDLKDAMNYTRRMWSEEFKCTAVSSNDVAIYGIAVAVGFLPFILYLGVWVYGSHQDRERQRLAAVPREATIPLNNGPNT